MRTWNKRSAAQWKVQGRNKVYEIRDQRLRGGIRDHSPGITTLGIGISSVFVESGIKIVNIFGIRDQNSQCFCDQGLKFSTFLWSGIKIWGKNTGSVMKKNTLLRPWKFPEGVQCLLLFGWVNKFLLATSLLRAQGTQTLDVLTNITVVISFSHIFESAVRQIDNDIILRGHIRQFWEE